MKIFFLASALWFSGIPLCAQETDGPLDFNGPTNFNDLKKKVSGQPNVPGAPVRSTRGEAEGKDLSNQFQDECRSQEGIGACHAFASVGLLEAASLRDNGKPVRLSEADLFLGQQVQNGAVYDNFKNKAGHPANLKDGADVVDDLRYALDHGVATGDRYDRLVANYPKWRTREEQLNKSINSMNASMSPVEKLFYDPYKHLDEIRNEPEAQKLRQRILYGTDDEAAQVAKDRNEMKTAFQGFKPVMQSFKTSPGQSDPEAINSVPPEQRLAKGTAQRDAILYELNKDRPVAVSMQTAGLGNWTSANASQNAEHAFIIKGYSRDADGHYIFHTRNSGGPNEDLKEEDLFRIDTLYSVRTPKEQKEEPDAPPKR